MRAALATACLSWQAMGLAAPSPRAVQGSAFGFIAVANRN
jgi:hypothetical protein